MLNPVRGPNAGAALAACTAILTLAAPVAAQNEAALKSYFEGNRVTLRLDMPGTSDGVDVQVDGRGVDYQRYGNDLKRYGTSIHVGESVSVTLVKVKRDLIEFQLGGGGFGTFGDDTSTSVPMRLLEKSEREKNLEKRVREEDDDRNRRRELQRDLDDLRDRRDRANRRIMEEHEQAEALKRELIADERLRGGSRFNLRYEDRVPPDMRPEDLIAVLNEYVEFRSDARDHDAPPPSATAGDISLLRKGMLRADAERVFGRAVESSERNEGGLATRTLVFVVGQQRITADFVEDVLVRYIVTSR